MAPMNTTNTTNIRTTLAQALELAAALDYLCIPVDASPGRSRFTIPTASTRHIAAIVRRRPGLAAAMLLRKLEAGAQ